MAVRRVKLHQLRNGKFIRLFLKNTLLVFAGVGSILLVAELSVYGYSSRLLIHEVDAANARGVENARATIETVCEETELAALRLALSSDVKALCATNREVFPDYKFISLANKVRESMSLSRRLNLDHSISMYLDRSDYILCTLIGGQRSRYYNDADLLPEYPRDRQEAYRVRRTSFDTFGNAPLWILTYYKPLESPMPDGSFVAINIQVELLAKYLQSAGAAQDTSSNVIVADREGTILMDTDLSLIGQDISAFFEREEDLDFFLSRREGAMTVELGGQLKRATWITGGKNNWEYMQVVPFDSYVAGMGSLRSFLLITIFGGVLFAIAVSFLISSRLFRPIADIIRIIEDPATYQELDDKSGEVKYLLMNVLNSFQKNISLEEEMLKKVAALRNTRAKALQEQITPHFLYNALQAINWLACMETQNEDSGTCRAIVTLSDLIRSGQDQSGNFVTVRKELENIEKFLEIERLRFGDGIRCTIEADPALLEENYLRMSLQPLVENAISHGLQPHGAAGLIQIRMEPREEGIYTCVADDGAGMTDEEIERFRQSLDAEYIYASRHIGLVNLCQRIRLVYGEEYGVNLAHSDSGGLKVEFVVPYVK